jgi:hypothetical protein
MAIYRLQSQRIVDLQETTFESEGILERKDLQRLLRERIDIVSPDTLVISEEFGEWEDSKRRVDLLGIDKQANLVVVELKRNETGAHMDLQAIRYAAMLSTVTFEKVVEIYAQYLKDNHREEINPRESLLSFLEWDEPREDQFAADVRIVLASAEFSKELTTAVMWLNERELDIQCVRNKPYRSDDDKEIFIDVQQIIPLPEATDYQIQLREKSELSKEAKAVAKDYTQYNFEKSVYGKNRLVLAVVSAYVRDNPGITFEQLKGCFPDDLQGGYGVVEEAESVLADTNKCKRFFTKPNEIVKLSRERKEVVVCSQWGLGNVTPLIAHAKELGFEITKAM